MPRSSTPRNGAIWLGRISTPRRQRSRVMIVKAKGPSGPAKIHSDDPKHALGLVQYLRTIGYTAWIEDTNGNEIEETVLKNAIKEMLHE